MTARLSSWFASAAQLCEIFVSKADRRAEFSNYSLVICIRQHRPGIVRLKAFCPVRQSFIGSAMSEGNILFLSQFLPIFPVGH